MPADLKGCSWAKDFDTKGVDVEKAGTLWSVYDRGPEKKRFERFRKLHFTWELWELFLVFQVLFFLSPPPWPGDQNRLLSTSTSRDVCTIQLVEIVVCSRLLFVCCINCVSSIDTVEAMPSE